jgi:hypothetical protein
MDTLDLITQAVESFKIGSTTHACSLHKIINDNKFISSSFCDEKHAREYMSTFREFAHAVIYLENMDKTTLDVLKKFMLEATECIKSIPDLHMQEFNTLGNILYDIISIRTKISDIIALQRVDVQVITTTAIGAKSYAFGASNASVHVRTLHACIVVYLALKSRNMHGGVLKNFNELVVIAGGSTKALPLKLKSLKINNGRKLNVTVMDMYQRLCDVKLEDDMKRKICNNAKFCVCADISPYVGPNNISYDMHMQYIESLSKISN